MKNRLSMFLQMYVVVGVVLVCASVPVCELTDYCPLVDYHKGTWSPLEGARS